MVINQLLSGMILQVITRRFSGLEAHIRYFNPDSCWSDPLCSKIHHFSTKKSQWSAFQPSFLLFKSHFCWSNPHVHGLNTLHPILGAGHQHPDTRHSTVALREPGSGGDETARALWDEQSGRERLQRDPRCRLEAEDVLRWVGFNSAVVYLYAHIDKYKYIYRYIVSFHVIYMCIYIYCYFIQCLACICIYKYNVYDFIPVYITISVYINYIMGWWEIQQMKIPSPLGDAPGKLKEH